MSSIRVDKLNSEFRKNIQTIISTKVKNPNLTEMFTITAVTCDSDLTLAKVYVSIFSNDINASQRTFSAIQSATGYIKSCLLKTMRIRTVPQLVFVMDDRMQNQDKITRILNEIHNDQEE
ncbi:MAG: 30S ribosome-binding factor RbfA [Clostridia bacterium]|nr:30S ribosome-binding factor RbfA [Clostridia bacterium]